MVGDNPPSEFRVISIRSSVLVPIAVTITGCSGDRVLLVDIEHKFHLRGSQITTQFMYKVGNRHTLTLIDLLSTTGNTGAVFGLPHSCLSGKPLSTASSHSGLGSVYDGKPPDHART